jgi:surface protein
MCLFSLAWPLISTTHSQDFVSVWRTTNPGSSNDQEIFIPTAGSGYNYNVSWGDGTFDVGVTGAISHNYMHPGTYTVSIGGDFPRIHFDNTGDKDKIIEIKEWGNIQWTSMERAFMGCSNLEVTASDTPILSNVSSLNSMFSGTLFNKDIGNWNISQIVDMHEMFSGVTIDKVKYNNILEQWSTQSLQSNVSFGAGNSTYCKGESARDAIITMYNWNITDGGKDCSEPFITEWEISFFDPEKRVTIPAVGSGFDFDIDWGDGNVDTNVTGTIAHNYNQNGNYKISISGAFPILSFGTSPDKEKLKAILQWGEIKWEKMDRAFSGCTNVRLQTEESPDLSLVASLNEMFRDASAISSYQSGGFRNWDVSNIKGMIDMFQGTKLNLYQYDDLLDSWSQLPLLQNVAFGAGESNYCFSQVSRNRLINDFNWSISDDGLDCSRPFVTLWKTDNPGTTGNLDIQIPTTGQGYNYSVDWGDGQQNVNVSGNITHSYQYPGIYEVSISGNFPRIHFNNLGDKDKILAVLDWGTGQWTSMRNAFYGCSNLELYSQHPPDLSMATDLSFAFKEVTSLIDIGPWDIGTILSMESMFEGATFLEGYGLEYWNISNVANMKSMFKNAISFAADISYWKFRNGCDASNMFDGVKIPTKVYDNWLREWYNLQSTNVKFGAGYSTFCESDEIRTCITALFPGSSCPGGVLNWTISDGGMSCDTLDYFTSLWKTDNPGSSNANEITVPLVNDGSYYQIFWGDGQSDFPVNGAITHVYNTPGIYQVLIYSDSPRIHFNNSGDKDKILEIKAWGDLAWSSMENAFYGCSNLQLQAYDTINLTQATSLRGMFRGAPNINANLQAWDVSNITDMSYLFQGATSFRGSLNNWDVSQVTDMSYMFHNAAAFNSKILKWDVNNVINMESAFQGAEHFNQNLKTWNTRSVNKMDKMFSGALRFNQPIGSWDVSMVNSMNSMFENADAFDQPLGDWNVGNVSTMDFMFLGGGLSLENYDHLLLGWNNLPLQPGVKFDGGSSQFCLGTEARNNMEDAFNWSFKDGGFGCQLTTAPFITRWKTNNPGTSSTTEITIPTTGGGYNYIVDWGDGKYNIGVTGSKTHQYSFPGTYRVSIYGQFPRIFFFNQGDKEKLVSIEQWGDIQWSSMSEAFYGCSNMIYNATDAPNLSNVTHTNGMFVNAQLFNGNLSNWDVSNVTNMGGMFVNAYAFNGDISNWNMSNVTTTEQMFGSAISFNQDISGWDVSMVNTMQWMFSGATSFDRNLGNWNISSATNLMGMFNGVTLSTTNYDSLLIGWNALPTIQPNVSFSGGNSQYCKGTAARASLQNMGWTITDGNQVPNCCPETNTYSLGSWSNGIPDATMDVIINDNYDTAIHGGSIDACGVVINPGVILTIDNGDYLNLKKELMIKGILILKESGTINTISN